MKKLLLATMALFMALPFYAAKVDTVNVRSSVMDKDIQTVVIVPEKAYGKKAANCPVIYLLHGYSGNAKTWINLKTDLPKIADEKGIIFVCPDGQNSWYWDSPVNKDSQYETFISKELIEYIDGNYKTVVDRHGRAITGLSMGGHGALFNAMRHKDQFAAAGSTSGGVDLLPFPQNWNLQSLLGEMANNKKVWDAHTVINQLDKIQNGDLAIIVDCGEDDFFAEVNKKLHTYLNARKIDHDFIMRPGAHNGPYWNNSIDYQILFFDKNFKKANQ